MATEAAPDDAANAPDAYDALLDRVERWNAVGSASGVLGWDQQVMMPEGGTPARSKQLSALSSVHHDMVTDDETGELLDELDDADLTDEQAAVVREVRREYERADAVPVELVEEISETGSEALQAWEEAKAEDDFETFAPYLEKHVELKREYAEHIDPDRDPYEVLFEEFEPCLSMERAESILTELREALVPMIEDIRASDVELAVDTFEGTFSEDEQEALSRDALELVGYDFDRGRLDVSSHPFTAGNQFDCRVTTRFDEEDPLGAVGSTIHEFGHAQYNLGLPQEHFGTPLGESRDLSVHESQSRLWENHVGRSEAFWQEFLPVFQEHFPQTEEASVRDAYEAFNQVYEDNLIRVEADELTYHLHIVIRFEIERDLIRGDLDVEDVPEVWNDKYEEYLGIRPDTDSEGCLQDIHWSHGNFGYFPTYSLGSVMAAQLFEAAEADIDDLDAKIADGEFGDLHDWLGENVHRHGSRYETNELVKRATGEDFSADAFLDYVDEKYGELYGI
ncbi:MULTISPECIES: carboxypeptidase M32 [unclassified Halorubrum]|uniref:carboxypeptidase M32 n=1 Tax=unclassified Halorubrum TaxID=2642239 RepID=UPI000EF22B1E|nr:MULTISPECIES: carboxypeptidase M32 [unclassified Halorubrum]RLM51600.1 carboxypeptidase M32 [Halorubrum sp. Atlit-28R]TKX46195.1 carboxypeptidase M32 [Halorubrum sp. ARQ200]TKX49227.1 carboxypeptidase M32 [Halorubrum sp. ASP121]